MGRTMGGIWFGGTGNKSFRWSDTKNSRIKISIWSFWKTLVGMVYGGVMYHYYGKEAPLLILAALIIVDACKYNIYVYKY